MHKPTIKIKFTDFYPGFIWNEHCLWKYIYPHFNVELSDDPDILIYSCFGTEFLKYKCPKIFYTAENIPPDFRFCDFAISYEYNDKPNHLRIPLYNIYFTTEQLTQTRDAEKLLSEKRQFCSFVVSNSNESQERILFFQALNNVLPVASGGKYANNVGGPVKNKRYFIRNYKFNIAFENSSYPGYTTEKIAEPWIEGCIPLYWGNPKISEEINPDCFINIQNFKNYNDAISYILDVHKSKELTLKYLHAPFYKNNQAPDNLNDIQNSLKVKNIIESCLIIKKTAFRNWHKAYYYFRKFPTINRLIKIQLR